MISPVKKRYEALGQEVEEATLPNGLKVVLLRKPGYQRKYLTFSTHYGGMDSVFVRPGESEPTRVPDGIAHFLEHKLFEEPDGTNVLDKYSRMGASPNAYTGQNYTVYLCSLVEQFQEGFDLLLDYVQNPYFTDENVRKEQGIIEQEIQMGLDSPIRMVYYNLIDSLYQQHPARIRVIGSVESIHEITKELLFACHDTFYHPSNMVVVVAGDVAFEEVARIASRDMEGRNYQPRGPIERVIPEEPPEVRQSEIRHKMQVSRPNVLMGFKGRLIEGAGEDRSEYHRRLIGAELALDAVLGKSTDGYWRLYEQGVIASRYGYSLTTFPGIAHFYVGCETEEPDAFRDRITDALIYARDSGIDAERFEEARKRAIGDMLSALDDLQLLAHLYVTHHFDGIDLFERRELLDQVSIDDAQAFLSEFVQENRRAYSVVEPLS